MGQAEDHGQFCKFRDLKAGGTVAEPAAASLTDTQGGGSARDQQEERNDGDPDGCPARVVEVDPACQEAEECGRKDAHHLLIEIEIGVLF